MNLRAKVLLVAILVLVPVVPCASEPDNDKAVRALTRLKARSKQWLRIKGTGKDRQIIEREAVELAGLGPSAIPAILSDLLEFDKREDILSEPEMFHFYHPILTDALYLLGKDAIPHLVDALKRGEESLTVAILLGHMDQRKHLNAIYRKSRGKTKFYAAVGLARAGEPGVTSYLLKKITLKKDETALETFLTDRQLRENFGALSTLADLGYKIFDILYKELIRPQGRRRENAWTLLDLIDPLERNSLVIRLLGHPSAKVRAAALGKIYTGTAEGAKALIKLLQEEKSELVFKKITWASCGSWVRWQQDDILIYIAALEIKDIKRRKKIYEAVKLMVELGKKVRGRRLAIRANSRLKALQLSIDLSRGKELLEKIRENPDKFFAMVLSEKEHEIEMYGEALAAGGKKLFNSLIDLIVNPAKGKTEWKTDSYQAVIAAEALKNINAGKAVAELVELLRSDDVEKCKRIIDAIARIGTKQAGKALLKTLREHKKPEIRMYAVYMLPPELLRKAMNICADEKDSGVREGIVWSLADSGETFVAPFLRKTFESLSSSSLEKDIKLTEWIIKRLAALELKEDEPLFLKLLTEGKTPEIRAAAAHGLGIIGSKETISALRKSLKNEAEIEVKREIVNALGRLEDKDSLKNLLKDKDLRVDAAIPLAGHGSVEAMPVLLDYLFHEHKESDLHKRYDIKRKQLRAAVALTCLLEDDVRKELDKRLSGKEGEFSFPQKWLHTWLGGKRFVQDMYKVLSINMKTKSYAAAALARNPERPHSNGNILAIEAAIQCPFQRETYLTCGWGLEIITPLFPEAPQIDRDRYYDYARCPQVDKFLNWYEKNRFSLRFDQKTKLYRLIY